MNYICSASVRTCGWYIVQFRLFWFHWPLQLIIFCLISYRFKDKTFSRFFNSFFRSTDDTTNKKVPSCNRVSRINVQLVAVSIWRLKHLGLGDVNERLMRRHKCDGICFNFFHQNMNRRSWSVFRFSPASNIEWYYDSFNVMFAYETIFALKLKSTTNKTIIASHDSVTLNDKQTQHSIASPATQFT